MSTFLMLVFGYWFERVPQTFPEELSLLYRRKLLMFELNLQRISTFLNLAKYQLASNTVLLQFQNNQPTNQRGSTLEIAFSTNKTAERNVCITSFG